MSTIRERMIADMQLHGYSAKTQTAYLGAVRGLAGHYHRTPEDITQDELRSYFVYLVKERGVARGTLTIHLSGIIYFFHHFAPFLGELNLEIALLHIRMLLLDLLDPLGHVCLQDALLSIDGAGHNDTFWEMI